MSKAIFAVCTASMLWGSSASAQSATVSAPAPPLACVSPAHRAFDYWVGRWDVYPTGANLLLAHSLIENLYSGCGIRENWMPLKGTGGGSLSSYDPADNRWHQRWIDNSGATVDFDGGPVKGEMVLTGLWRNIISPGTHALIRMTYARNQDGSVRQLGQQSVDHGLTWQPSFDFTYRRSAPQ